jgi:hypothetical protein
MRYGDEQKGIPFCEYNDTKANIEALVGLSEGCIAYATDTDELGTYDGAAWEWISAVSDGVILADGTVPLTADWDAGSYKITAEQLESDIAIGTAPFVVTSTTVVTNLNADTVDGYDLDQDVSSGESPTFDGDNFTGMDADDVDIADAGEIITATNVEGALQEIAGDVDDLEAFVDQDVTSGADPVLEGTNFTLIPVGGILATDKGIGDGDLVLIDSATVADDEYARFTASGLESRSIAEMKSDLAIKYQYEIHIEGSLAAQTGVGNNIIIPRNCTLEKVIMYVETQGSADSTTIDVHQNGTTVYTTQGNRPSVAHDDADGIDDGDTPDVTALSANDILTVDIDAVATGAIGLDVLIITY